MIYWIKIKGYVKWPRPHSWVILFRLTVPAFTIMWIFSVISCSASTIAGLESTPLQAKPRFSMNTLSSVPYYAHTWSTYLNHITIFCAKVRTNCPTNGSESLGALCLLRLVADIRSFVLSLVDVVAFISYTFNTHLRRKSLFSTCHFKRRSNGSARLIMLLSCVRMWSLKVVTHVVFLLSGFQSRVHLWIKILLVHFFYSRDCRTALECLSLKYNCTYLSLNICAFIIFISAIASS